jgi:hypothetical protein
MAVMLNLSHLLKQMGCFTKLKAKSRYSRKQSHREEIFRQWKYQFVKE